MSTAIERTSLEAHVEIDEHRHAAMLSAIENLREQVEELEAQVAANSEATHQADSARQKQIITIAGTIIGILLSALVGTLLQLIK